MSVGFRAVQWNRDKLVYDAILIAAVIAYIVGFGSLYKYLYPPKDLPEAIDVWIRVYGSCAFLMLTAILCIGPLARLDRRFLPLLYNRRHFGVLTFLIALTHASLMIAWYLVQGSLADLGGELTAWGDYAQFIGFPFKALGLAALVILFLMAATSHDFWLTLPGPAGLEEPAHGALSRLCAGGDARRARADAGHLNPLVPAMLIVGFGTVAVLHLAAAYRERKLDRDGCIGADGWIAVGPPLAIPDKGARIVAAPGGERIAVFRDGDEIGALTNLCAHQNGPLGEGRIIDGCVTCPWHGYQYRLSDGCAPPPFTEKLETFRLRLRDGMVEVDPRPLPPGTPAAIRCPAGAL